MEKIDGVFASLPDKDKKELVSQIVPGQPVPYDERLGWTKDEYAKYLECWKLKQVQEVAPVAVGIFRLRGTRRLDSGRGGPAGTAADEHPEV